MGCSRGVSHADLSDATLTLAYGCRWRDERNGPCMQLLSLPQSVSPDRAAQCTYILTSRAGDSTIPLQNSLLAA
jgi:hypothetical protein